MFVASRFRSLGQKVKKKNSNQDYDFVYILFQSNLLWFHSDIGINFQTRRTAAASMEQSRRDASHSEWSREGAVGQGVYRSGAPTVVSPPEGPCEGGQRSTEAYKALGDVQQARSVLSLQDCSVTSSC